MARSREVTARCADCHALIRVKTHKAEKSLACPACRAVVRVTVPQDEARADGRAEEGRPKSSPLALTAASGGSAPEEPAPYLADTAPEGGPVSEDYGPDGPPDEWWERLDKAAVAAGVAGFLGLVLVMVMSTGVWYEAVYRTAKGTRLHGSEALEGTAYVEGKVVFLLALGAAVGVGLALVRREWLPWSLVAAGACGAFSVPTLWALWGRLAAQYESAARSARAGASLHGGPGWALVFCLLAGALVAVAFAVAARRNPPTLSLVQQPSYPDFVRRYGGLVGAYLVAFIVGAGFAVIRR